MAGGESADTGRESVLDRLRQTALEADALSKTFDVVPDELTWQRPGDSPSVAELLWLIHLADQYRFTPVAKVAARGEHPRLEHVHAAVLLGTDPCPEDDVSVILSQVQSSRKQLIEALEELSHGDWDETTVIVDGGTMDWRAFVEQIVAHDEEVFRAIGHRLFESRLSSNKTDDEEYPE